MAKTSKRALLLSALAIVLCIAMLIGTTYAWFTDTAATAVNRIQSGSLKVGIIDMQGNSLEGKQLKWQAADGREQDEILWEPGCTYYLEPFMIQNQGNLALKYKITVNGFSGDNELLEALEFGFYYFSPGFGGARTLDELAAGGKLDNVSEYPGLCTAPIYIFAHMKEEAGNKYQGLSIDGAGITVYATQYTYEKDSFDNQYDKDAAYAWDGTTATTDWYNTTDNEFIIEDAADLAGIAKLAEEGNTFEGKTITLADNVNLGGENWTPIKSFKGEFDGNGKTVYGLKLNASRAGLFKTLESGSDVHDLKIDGADLTVGAGERAGVLSYSVGGKVENVEVKNIKATVTDPSAMVSGMCAWLASSDVRNCTVENMEVNAPEGATFIAGFASIMHYNTPSDCNVNNLKINVSNTASDECGVGGFGGQTQTGWGRLVLNNCNVTGLDITAKGNVQIGGFMPWPGAHTIAGNCSVSGRIDATGIANGYAGGFFGNLGWNHDLGHMGHEITDCTTNVAISTKNAAAGGFVGTATNSNNASMYATFKCCRVLGNVTCTGGTASIGGFAGVADRGYYENCSVSGNVSGGAVNGGFIGTVKHIDAKYQSSPAPRGTREYDVEQITVDSCTGSAGLELIGTDDQSNKDSLNHYYEIVIR